MARGKLDTIALAKEEFLKEIIRSLWRDYPGLSNEKYKNDETWLRNVFSDDIDFGAALGQANLIEGNRSTAIGQGNNTKAFMELLLGAYATIAEEQDPEAWVATDRLAALGNGVDDNTRSLAYEVFKSGLFKLFNGLKIGKYVHGEVDPDNWTLSVEDDGLSYWLDGAWHLLGGGGASAPTTITSSSTNSDNGTNHTHELDNVGTAKTVTLASITVDAKGRVTACSSGSLPTIYSIGGYFVYTPSGTKTGDVGFLFGYMASSINMNFTIEFSLRDNAQALLTRGIIHVCYSASTTPTYDIADIIAYSSSYITGFSMVPSGSLLLFTVTFNALPSGYTFKGSYTRTG